VSTGDGARDEERPALATPWGAYRKWTIALAGLAVVFVVLVGYDLISGGVLTGAPASTATSPKATASSTRPTASASSSPTASSSSSAMPTGPAVTLTVANATAFGPDGTSDGDNPGMASRMLRGGGAWDSSWYATAEFGHMQSGTGILLDMGHAVTVNSIGLVLGTAAGADVQVRVGNSAGLESMSTAASMSNAHGTLHLPLSSAASTRYVLIWFTKLPVKSPGKYQVSLYKATVDGHV
jgi:putative peptidoglycan lipid II flippase